MKSRIVINGAGIAGPTLAYWLRKSGHEVVLVESAPALRRGGYIVDFWGLGYDIAEKMGVLPEVRGAGYQVREVRFVDRHGKKTGGFAVDVFDRLTHGRFTSVRRSDISAAIHGALDAGVTRLYGDSIAGIESAGHRVRVTFEHAAADEFDLVVGADGLHSRVRHLVFGNEAREVSLGYHVAAFECEGYRPRDELVYVTYGVPGRQVSRFSMRGDRTLFLFIVRDEYLGGERIDTGLDRKAQIARIFGGLGWECAQIVAALGPATDFYFDTVSQIRMDRWTRGRVALVGDAAACVSLLAGEGTGLAMAEAYVLAGELDACAGDYSAAFARYESRMMPFIAKKQASASRFASAFAPRTAIGIAIRSVASRALALRPVADRLVGRDLRDDIELPQYEFELAGRRAFE